MSPVEDVPAAGRVEQHAGRWTRSRPAQACGSSLRCVHACSSQVCSKPGASSHACTPVQRPARRERTQAGSAPQPDERSNSLRPAADHASLQLCLQSPACLSRDSRLAVSYSWLQCLLQRWTQALGGVRVRGGSKLMSLMQTQPGITPCARHHSGRQRHAGACRGVREACADQGWHSRHPASPGASQPSAACRRRGWLLALLSTPLALGSTPLPSAAAPRLPPEPRIGDCPECIGEACPSACGCCVLVCTCPPASCRNAAHPFGAAQVNSGLNICELSSRSCVSSQNDEEDHFLPPWIFEGSLGEAVQRLKAVATGVPSTSGPAASLTCPARSLQLVRLRSLAGSHTCSRLRTPVSATSIPALTWQAGCRRGSRRCSLHGRAELWRAGQPPERPARRGLHSQRCCALGAPCSAAGAAARVCTPGSCTPQAGSRCHHTSGLPVPSAGESPQRQAPSRRPSRDAPR